jgi:putative transposase
VPWGLKRYQQSQQLHFITFSCFHRAPLLSSTSARDTFVAALERVRCWYGLYVAGYVIMPEHVHLLLSEPERGSLRTVLQILKQAVSRRLARPGKRNAPFWQARYYDFNVWSDRKRIEKLRYMHRNPVKRGLCERPEDWQWSSFRHYLTGADAGVEIESPWTARKRTFTGIMLKVSDAGQD